MISVCTIYDDGDEHNLTDMISTIPAGVEIVLMKTIPNDTDKQPEQIGFFENNDCKIKKYRWLYNRNDYSFSRFRNTVKRLASGQWLIMLDADERLNITTSELELIENPPIENVGGYNVQLANYEFYNERIVTTFSTSALRIIRNHPGMFYKNRVHESIVDGLTKFEYKIIDTTIAIKHLGYLNSLEIMMNKLERNYQLAKLDIAENPGNPEHIKNLLQTFEGFRKIAYNNVK